MTPAEMITSSDRATRDRGNCTIRKRIKRLGWDIEKALNTPIGPHGGLSRTVPRSKEDGPRRQGEVTLEEIAIEMGISREGVRQIEERALAKLRTAFERMGLDEREVCAWLDSKAGDPDQSTGGSEVYTANTLCTHDSCYYRWREPDVAAEERIEREAEAFARDIVETARAHRFVERVCCGMEDGGEVRVLDEQEPA